MNNIFTKPEKYANIFSMDSVLRKEYFDKAFKLHNAGNFDEAKTFYNKIVSENSDDAETYNLIGICELQQQNYAKAEEYVKHAIELRKNQYFYEIWRKFIFSKKDMKRKL